MTEAVIFDWGGTLTPWHDIDFTAEATALADASDAAPDAAERLRRAGETIWTRSRDEHRSATIADIFTEAGLEHHPDRLGAYWEFWEPHTFTDPAVGPMWRRLRQRGVRIGVLSNTVWPREWHRKIFRRDGVLDLIDGDVYSSEIGWSKPSTHAFEAAMAALCVRNPARCVYVGDRLFEDVWGAQNAGMRAIHIPNSTIPVRQVGHTEGVPDAVAPSLEMIPTLLDRLDGT